MNEFISILGGFDSGRSVGSGIAHLRYLLLGRFQDLEGADEVLVDAHQRA
jgi:hypothetical protein